MADFPDDISGNMGFTGRRNSYRFVILDVNRRLAPRNDLPVTSNDVARGDLIAKPGDARIDRDASGLDQAVRLAPRADTVLGKEFIDANRVCHDQRVED